jgi:hypothetical protein
MEMREVVPLAKQYLTELFAAEKIQDLGLEEIELDSNDHVWAITIGFSRPWDVPRNPLAAIAADAYTRRIYKVVRIADQTRELVSIKNREVAA